MEQLDQKLDSSIKKAIAFRRIRFVSKNHPDKPGSQYIDDEDGWRRAEIAAHVLRDHHVRLLYFRDEAHESVTEDSPIEADDEVVHAIRGATPNRCTQPWLTDRPGSGLDLDWSCASAAFSSVHTYRLQASKSIISLSWETIWEGSRPSTTVAPKYRTWVFRCCAINGFGSGGYSSSTSLVQQQQQEQKKRASVKTQRGTSTRLTRKEALEQRRKQEAREQLQHAMSSHSQRAVNAYDILIDAIAASKKLRKLSTGDSSADDDILIQRAKSLSITLKSRNTAKAEVGEWKHHLKHSSNEELVTMLNTIQADEINPTVVNMIKQTVDKRSASDDFAEMREVLLAAAQRSDVFKREWQNHFFMMASVLERKIAQHNKAQANRQAQLEAERQKKERARAAAEIERRRRQENKRRTNSNASWLRLHVRNRSRGSYRKHSRRTRDAAPRSPRVKNTTIPSLT